MANKFNIEDFMRRIRNAEHHGRIDNPDYNPYTKVNSDGAMGAYQFRAMWLPRMEDFNRRMPEGERYTFNTPQDFTDNSSFQDDFMGDVIRSEYIPQSRVLQEFNKAGLTQEQILAGIHFLGYPTMKETLQTNDFDTPKSYKTTLNDYFEHAGLGRVNAPHIPLNSVISEIAPDLDVIIPEKADNTLVRLDVDNSLEISEFQDGDEVYEEDTVWQGVTDLYPILGKLRSKMVLHQDKGFTRERTGRGDIEYFDPKTDAISYNDDFTYNHPSPGKHAMVFNPTTNTLQTIGLDMLHALPSVDSTYADMRRSVGDAFMSSIFKDDFLADADRVRKEVGEEKFKQWYGDNQGYFDKSYLDGVIRGMAFQGSPEEFETYNYWPEARDPEKGYFQDQKLRSRFQTLESYLKEPDVKKFGLGDTVRNTAQKVKSKLGDAGDRLETMVRKRLGDQANYDRFDFIDRGHNYIQDKFGAQQLDYGWSDSGSVTGHDDYADLVRHALMSAWLAREQGADVSLALGTGHEIVKPSDFASDTRANIAGAGIGMTSDFDPYFRTFPAIPRKSDEQIFDELYEMLQSGELPPKTPPPQYEPNKPGTTDYPLKYGGQIPEYKNGEETGQPGRISQVGHTALPVENLFEQGGLVRLDVYEHGGEHGSSSSPTGNKVFRNDFTFSSEQYRDLRTDFFRKALKEGYTPRSFKLPSSVRFHEESRPILRDESGAILRDVGGNPIRGKGSCTGGVCQATQSIMPSLGVPGLITLKEQWGVGSGTEHANLEWYGESVDAWDIQAVLRAKGGKALFTAKTRDDVHDMSAEEFETMVKKFPVGTVINYGYGHSSGSLQQDERYEGSANVKAGMLFGTHSAVVVGYNEDGIPVIYDFGEYRAISPFSHGNMLNVTVPKEYEKFTREYLDEQGLLNREFDYEPVKLHPEKLQGKLVSGDKTGQQFNENRMATFTQTLEKEKGQLLSALENISSNEEYDMLANMAVALAMAESKGGNPTGLQNRVGSLADLTPLGDSVGLTQINVDTFWGKDEETGEYLDPALVNKLAEFDIKGKDDLRNDRKSALATMIYLSEAKNRAERAYKNGLKENWKPENPRDGVRVYRADNSLKGQVRDLDKMFIEETQEEVLLPRLGVGTEASAQKFQAYLDENNLNDTYALKRDDRGYLVEKKTKGNKIKAENPEEELAMKIAYFWNTPSALFSGDAQGENVYVKKVLDYYRTLRE